VKRELRRALTTTTNKQGWLFYCPQVTKTRTTDNQQRL
jgi:hypothetical protein